MSEDKELFSLTELAEDVGISWRSYLSKAIRNGSDIYARLKGVESVNVHSSRLTLCNLEEMNEFRTPNGDVLPKYVKKYKHYISWANKWLLSKKDHYKLQLDMPPWEITQVIPDWVLIENSEGEYDEKEINNRDRDVYTSQIQPVLVNENNLFLFKSSVEAEGKRKPHTAFIVVAKTDMKIKRGEAWNRLINYAQESRGQKEVMLPGWGKTYLRRVRFNPHKEILYSHEQFDYDKSENLPFGVFLITHKQFDKSWTMTTQQKS